MDEKGKCVSHFRAALYFQTVFVDPEAWQRITTFRRDNETISAQSPEMWLECEAETIPCSKAIFEGSHKFNVLFPRSEVVWTEKQQLSHKALS